MIHSFKTFELFLRRLTTNEDRHVKGHSLALLKRLQELNVVDEDIRVIK